MSAIGKTFGPVTYQVGREKIREYARAVGETDPRHLDVEAGDPGDDHRAGAEPVGAVPVAGVDRLADAVARHGEQVQVDPAPRRG